MFLKKLSNISWLIVCLGNVGERYEGTRHNVGFDVANELGKRGGFPIRKLKYKALTEATDIAGQRVLVMKPTTFMNLSGEAAAAASSFYKIPPQQVLVVCDDVSLPLGKLRVRRGGSAGGHNGLKSMIAHLGSDQFPRVKIGVGGKPHPDYDMVDWVLGKFQGEDQKIIQAAVERAADAVEFILREGVEMGMNRFN